MTDAKLLATLQSENARLIALLDAHGIDWHLPVEPVKIQVAQIEPLRQLNTDGKVALFSQCSGADRRTPRTSCEATRTAPLGMRQSEFDRSPQTWCGGRAR